MGLAYNSRFLSNFVKRIHEVTTSQQKKQMRLFCTRLFVTLWEEFTKLLRLSKKNKRVCFVLHSTFRNFAANKFYASY